MDGSFQKASHKCQREKEKMFMNEAHNENYLSSLTHDHQETRSVDSEVVVHRIRVFSEVAENREPWSHVSLL